jgi:hypothetical protein
MRDDYKGCYVSAPSPKKNMDMSSELDKVYIILTSVLSGTEGDVKRQIEGLRALTWGVRQQIKNKGA